MLCLCLNIVGTQLRLYIYVIRRKDSQLVDDGWCAAGERSLVDVVGGVVRYKKDAVCDMRLSGGVT